MVFCLLYMHVAMHCEQIRHVELLYMICVILLWAVLNLAHFDVPKN
jgi:hypothetical protein